MSLANHETSKGRCPLGMRNRVKFWKEDVVLKELRLDKIPGTLGMFAWYVPVSQLP